MTLPGSRCFLYSFIPNTGECWRESFCLTTFDDTFNEKVTDSGRVLALSDGVFAVAITLKFIASQGFNKYQISCYIY
jgi:hypothetical protein